MDRGGWEQGGRTEATSIRHTVGMTLVFGDLLCRGPYQLYDWRNKKTPCRFHCFLPHRCLQSLRPAAWVPHCSLPLHYSQVLDTRIYTGSHSSLCVTQVQDTNLDRPQWLSSSLCVHSGISPSAMHMHAADLAPSVASTVMFVPMWDPVAMEVHADSEGPTAAVGPGPALSLVTDLYCWAYL